MNRSKMLPAVIMQQIAPLIAVETVEKPRLKVIWERMVTVDYYKTTINALFPVIKLVDNSDLFKVQSIKRGHRNIRLSVIDLWEDELMLFPTISQVCEKIAQADKEPAGLIELSLFAQILNRENILVNYEDILVLAIREYNRLGDSIKAFPSLTKENEHGIMLGLTYDWVIKKHHALYLVIG